MAYSRGRIKLPSNKNYHECYICGSCSYSDCYQSGEHFFHKICYEYLKNDRALKGYDGIEEKVNSLIEKIYKGHRFRKVLHFILRKLPGDINIEIAYLTDLEERLYDLEENEYNKFRNKKLKALYNFWGSYEFDSNKGYPPDWRKRRDFVLQRDKICQDCECEIENNFVVHHEKPVGANGIYDHKVDNLVLLCNECHNERHGGEPYTGPHEPPELPTYFIYIAQVINDNRSINNTAKRKVVWFNYTQHEGYKSIRAVLPHRTFHKNYHNYLTGYCYLREERRTFRIDRIENLEIINKNEIPDGGGKLL